MIRRLLALLPLLAALAAAPAAAAPGHWVLSWASAQQVPEPGNALPADALRDATLRQLVRLSAGGKRLRVRLSNAFGTAPLTIDATGIALAAAAPGAIAPATHRPVLFAGKAEVTIPAGAEVLSDPVALAVPPRARLAVTLHLAAPPQQQTGHPGARTTAFLAHGNAVAAATLAGAVRVEHWYQLSGIEVESAGPAGTIVALGDSITDGHGATTDADDRWPDRLAERLQHSGRGNIAVANAGIGGNRLLLDGLGPNALARFDRDVLAAAGVRAMILLEGINDLGTATREHPLTPADHAALVTRIVAAYGQIVSRAHAHGLRVIGGTLTPFIGSDYYHPDAATEADRQAINAWIRAPGHFDAVADFDRIVRDPAHRERLRPAFDSGDHLHPSPGGYAAMAAAVPLAPLGR